MELSSTNRNAEDSILYMISFLKKLAAVPIRTLAGLLGLLRIFDTARLWSACWKLSRNPEDATKLLAAVSQTKGPDAAASLAAKIVEEAKACDTAAMVACIELMNGNLDAAHNWIKLAEDKNYKNPEHLLLVKLLLSDYHPEYDKRKITEQVLSRNDLPMTITHLALINKAFILLEEKENEEAEKTADRILGICEDPCARIVKWAICLVNNKSLEAEIHLKKARQKRPPRLLNPLIAQACLCTGDIDAAMEWLYQAGELDYKITASNSPVGRLSRSQQFQDFCRERQNL